MAAGEGAVPKKDLSVYLGKKMRLVGVEDPCAPRSFQEHMEGWAGICKLRIKGKGSLSLSLIHIVHILAGAFVGPADSGSHMADGGAGHTCSPQK